MEMIRKVATADVAGLDFVLSDATVDRYGDVVDPAGWELTAFKANPIALFGHSGGFPIGTWEGVRVEGGKLLGRLKMAAAGTSQRIDELRSLIEQGILRAVSVGFAPLEREPIDKRDPYGPQRYIRQELLETSVVSVPANPAALARAVELGISADTQDLVFGEHADGNPAVVRRGATGGHAATSTSFGRPKMNLSDQIVALQDEIRNERDNLGQFTAEAGFNLADSRTMAQSIKAKEEELTGLREVEDAMAAAPPPTIVRAGNGAIAAPAVQRIPLNMARREKEVPLGDYVLRAHVVNALAKITQRSKAEIMADRYGQDEMTQRVFSVVTRAAAVPATTTGAGWADTLVQTSIGEFFDSLLAASVFPGLSERGIRTGLGRNGSITYPSRSSTPASVAGAFIAQGAPIPVKQALFAPITLGLKKMGVITTFTREIAEHSTPDIEGLLRRFITEDTSSAIDAVLVSASAATAIAPAGIRNGVTKTTASVVTPAFSALVADVKALQTALVTASNGNLRSPVWLMNPIQATSISLTQNNGGDFPFAAQINGNTLGGYPVIMSTTIAAGMVILIDAADFASVTGDDMRFDISDQATIHMEDTTPLPIATGPQGTGVLATPTRSLWQTDSLGLRMIVDINWALLRTGTVAWTDTITW